MIPYKSKTGKRSGVTAYRIEDDRIIIEFNNLEKYTYSYRSAGKTAIEKMKSLAIAQRGLSTFISKENPGYE